MRRALLALRCRRQPRRRRLPSWRRPPGRRTPFWAPTAGTDAVYVSVDLGVVEGVEDPVGLSASDLSPALGIVTASRLAGADLCGVVPGHGGGVPAAALAARLAADIVAAVARQRA